MTSKINLLITASPDRIQTHLTAIKFVEAALMKSVQIRSVFFYQDAVRIADRNNISVSNEHQLTSKWISLSDENNIELQTCVAASYRRGVLDQEEAEQRNLKHANFHQCFQMVGLGQLAASMADKHVNLIHFK